MSDRLVSINLKSRLTLQTVEPRHSFALLFEDLDFMKLRFFAAMVAALLMTASAAAHAQAGIYVNPIASYVTNSVADHGPFAFLGDGSTSNVFWGVSMGGYYDFFRQGKLEAGIDVRDTYQHGNNALLNNFLVGARVQGSPFKMPFKPYAQLAVGAGTTSAPTSQIRITRATGVFTGGVDYTLNHRFDFRVVEVSYGTLATVSTATIGSGPSIPNSHLWNFSTGFVIKLP
jgi:hypothetical protein